MKVVDEDEGEIGAGSGRGVGVKREGELWWSERKGGIGVVGWW